jgi:hypothetical protein
MARRPARLERAGALTPRDRMWAAIRALSVGDEGIEQLFSPVEVQFLANLRAPAEGQSHIDSVISYLEGLAKAEPPYVALFDGERPASRKRSELFLYSLVRDVGVDAPRVTRDGKPVTDGIGGEQMWTAMRVMREFDYLELAHAASTDQHQVKPETAKRYLQMLERAGYVTVISAGKPGRGKVKTVYRFSRAKATGPRAPLITREKCVMDANTGAIVYDPREARQ